MCTGETKQPLNRRMVQRKRDNNSEPDLAVYLHLKGKGHSFKDEDVHILDKEERWFERGVREAIHVSIENPSLNRGGGLRHSLSASYQAVLSKAPRQIKKPSPLLREGFSMLT